ncbi:TetR/AcrR family transcriptional regulator [Paenibacillus sp. 19GGS1-52]|uniref:TetR/AcrR family transcriptional regulator n=1 Tax=Paenibacillus sp. 19GGS1-52 TaxID=2758563 RepID=UPI001EFC246C|nr:TetR/AcrR family transcriptional regulator [Paenibacillus sp. 19GGS1-52]ULO09467.1 TetR/AcrR family transcriptional regulator [Paenibacillus sp. 19GGS1-52]
MRHKDESKNEAIFQATMELINEVGFSDISMSKIAKRASLSSATIYVYFANKEDMLVKLYINVKEKMSRQMIHELDDSLSTQELCEWFMRNSMKFILDNKDYFMFLEQFSTSPLMDKLCLEDTATMFIPLHEFIEKGKQKGDLKPLDTVFLLTYCYFPVTQLAKAHFKGQLDANEDRLQQIIRMSWDAIRL